MIQIRIHGRGGQGVVTAAELIALAAFYQGKYAQAFPFFGVERSGAPIQSFARISDSPISTREKIYQPDIIIIQDDSLISSNDVFAGAHNKTKAIINTSLNNKEFNIFLKQSQPANKRKKLPIQNKNIFLVPATEIAIEIFKKNLVNTPLLGALAKYTGLITKESIKKAIEEKFSDKDKNIIAQNIEAAIKTLSYEK